MLKKARGILWLLIIIIALIGCGKVAKETGSDTAGDDTPALTSILAVSTINYTSNSPTPNLDIFIISKDNVFVRCELSRLSSIDIKGPSYNIMYVSSYKITKKYEYWLAKDYPLGPYTASYFNAVEEQSIAPSLYTESTIIDFLADRNAIYLTVSQDAQVNNYVIVDFYISRLEYLLELNFLDGSMVSGKVIFTKY